MAENINQPKDDDAVLGEPNLPPVNAAVFGGIEEIKERLTNGSIEQKIAALKEALLYGESGLELVIQALEDESIEVKETAYTLLQTVQLIPSINMDALLRVSKSRSILAV